MILDMPRPAKAAAMRLMLGTPSLQVVTEKASIKFKQRDSKMAVDRLTRQVFDRGQMS
jgi:hypothetical protein